MKRTFREINLETKRDAAMYRERNRIALHLDKKEFEEFITPKNPIQSGWNSEAIKIY